jgi:hypothetical protein
MIRSSVTPIKRQRPKLFYPIERKSPMKSVKKQKEYPPQNSALGFAGAVREWAATQLAQNQVPWPMAVPIRHLSNGSAGPPADKKPVEDPARPAPQILQKEDSKVTARPIAEISEDNNPPILLPAPLRLKSGKIPAPLEPLLSEEFIDLVADDAALEALPTTHGSLLEWDASPSVPKGTVPESEAVKPETITCRIEIRIQILNEPTTRERYLTYYNGGEECEQCSRSLTVALNMGNPTVRNCLKRSNKSLTRFFCGVALGETVSRSRTPLSRAPLAHLKEAIGKGANQVMTTFQLGHALGESLLLAPIAGLKIFGRDLPQAIGRTFPLTSVEVILDANSLGAPWVHKKETQ